MLKATVMARARAHDDAGDTTPVRRRFTIDEYHRMGEAGIFHEDDRVELLDGEIVEMSPIGTRHTGGVNRLTAVYRRPTAVGYREHHRLERGRRIAPLAFPRTFVRVNEILG